MGIYKIGKLQFYKIESKFIKIKMLCIGVWEIIFSFQKGKKANEWFDGDLAVKLKYYYLIEMRKTIMLFTAESVNLAVKQNDFNLIRFLCEDCFVDFDDYSIIDAAKLNNLKALQYFHLHYEYKKQICYLGHGPMLTAVKYGNLNIVKWLWENKLNNNNLIYQWNNVIECAAKYGNLKIIQYFISKNVPYKFNTIIYIAKTANHKHIVKWLVRNLKNRKILDRENEQF